MVAIRSIPALTPPIDREVLRAIVQRQGNWARTPGELAIAAADHFGRILGRWTAHPEDALCEAILEALGQPDAAVAVPSWARPTYREVLPRLFAQIHWMEPAPDRLDPGADEVRLALDSGAKAVLLAPITGDCSALPKVSALCTEAGALLALDARASVGSRVGELSPEDFGDLLLVPVDGEPGPSLFSGAILFGSRKRGVQQPRPRTTLRRSLPFALRLLAHTVLYEPRLRSLWKGPQKETSAPKFDADKAPRWAFAAAQARLHQSSERWTQRARHVRALHLHCSHLPGTKSLADPQGSVAAGAAFPLRVPDAELVRRNLRPLGVQCVPGLADWLAPKGMRGPIAEGLAAEAIFLPLHPFYRPDDMGFLAEGVRRAVLRSGGGGIPDEPAAALAPLEAPVHDGGHPALRIVKDGAA